MSQYVNFFVRNKDNFIPIADYSRSTEIFRVFSHRLPWEKIRLLTDADLSFALYTIDQDIESMKKQAKKEKELAEKICTFDNDISEKIEAISECDNYINECEDAIEEYTRAKYFISFLQDINDSNYEYENKESFIYAGMEIGEPTIDDIKEEKNG